MRLLGGGEKTEDKEKDECIDKSLTMYIHIYTRRYSHYFARAPTLHEFYFVLLAHSYDFL